jgi:ribosomal protein S2
MMLIKNTWVTVGVFINKYNKIQHHLVMLDVPVPSVPKVPSVKRNFSTHSVQGLNEKKNTSTKMETTLKKLLVVKQQNLKDTVSDISGIAMNLQLGHERRYRHPAMTGFLYGQRKGVGDFFDLREFSRHLKQAYRFVEEIAKGSESNFGFAYGSKTTNTSDVEKVVIFVAKDKSHYKLLKPLFAALTLKGVEGTMKKTTKVASLRDAKVTPILLEKWTPGLLTQGRFFDTKKKTKKTSSTIKKTALGDTREAVPALIITFGNKLLQQIKREALITKTPLIAVVDSDQDPRDITYVIPCNDDNYKGQYFLGRVLLDPFFSSMGGFDAGQVNTLETKTVGTSSF